jgi:hypothetical protein
MLKPASIPGEGLPIYQQNPATWHFFFKLSGMAGLERVRLGGKK